MYRNPIQVLRLRSPDFVWNWYENKFKAAVKEYSEGRDGNHYQTIVTSFNKYREGISLGKSLVRVNINLRRIMEREFPILHPDKFFIGSEAEQKQEAIETADRMIKIYKQELHRQTAEIVAENETV